ncbi:MAG: tRNA (5-methylaminomethyl-2-thiouridine)(34)-methyltransferase MnmD [Cyclobacteriaceae bacterium]
MSLLKLIITRDGSLSLLNTVLNETYHSVHGAVQESNHVFIEKGLHVAAAKNTSLKILEIGFGTGLNALLTLQHAQVSQRTIDYTSLEAFPVPEEIWSALNYTQTPESKDLFEKLHRAGWNDKTVILPNFYLQKLHTTLQQTELNLNYFDLVYFDAFAPNKQPEMWELPMLQKVTNAMKPGGLFVTYCAKGQLKRDLKSLNLLVETLQGPPGKREMISASK